MASQKRRGQEKWSPQTMGGKKGGNPYILLRSYNLAPPAVGRPKSGILVVRGNKVPDLDPSLV